MGIVARDAAEAATALLITLAFAHLFDVSAKLLASLVGTRKDGQELAQRQSRSKIKRVSPRAFDAVVAKEMALFADRIPQAGLQVPGIDDAEIAALDHLRLGACNSPGPWQRSHPMARLPRAMGGSYWFVERLTGSTLFA